MKIRLAVVDVGKIVREQHHPAIAGDGGFDPVATVDPAASPSTSSRHATLGDLLTAAPAVDAAAICTPPQVWEAIALEALRSRRHVLLEKPPAGTLSGAVRLTAAAMPGRTLFASQHGIHARRRPPPPRSLANMHRDARP